MGGSVRIEMVGPREYRVCRARGRPVLIAVAGLWMALAAGSFLLAPPHDPAMDLFVIDEPAPAEDTVMLERAARIALPVEIAISAVQLPFAIGLVFYRDWARKGMVGLLLAKGVYKTVVAFAIRTTDVMVLYLVSGIGLFLLSYYLLHTARTFHPEAQEPLPRLR